MNISFKPFLLALLFVSPAALSQPITKYFTYDYKPSTPGKATFTRQGEPDGNKWHAVEFDKYATEPYCEGWYLDSNFTIADGPYTTYFNYKAKTIHTRGQFANGKKTGLWLGFFDSGHPQDSTWYNDDHIVRSRGYYASGKVHDSMRLDATGSGASVGLREDGRPEHTGQYAHWDRTGAWTYYDRQGVLCAIETRNADTITSAVFYDEAGKNPVTVTRGFEQESEYAGGAAAWMSYMNKTLAKAHFPDEYINGKVWGTVVVEFVIDATGAVIDVTVIHSIHPKLDQLAVNVIKNSSGKWTPARQHNRLVKSYKKQPVTFGKVQ